MKAVGDRLLRPPPRRIVTTATVFISVCLAGVASAQDQPADKDTATRLSVELEPFDYVLGGWSIGGGITLGSLPHWRLSASVYALNLPSFLVELESANRGWTVSITRAADVSVNYSFSSSGSGVFVGAVVNVERYELRYGDETAVATKLGVIPEVGYTWFPFQKWFYVRGWIGIQANVTLSGSQAIGGRRYSESGIMPLATIYLGYQS